MSIRIAAVVAVCAVIAATAALRSRSSSDPHQTLYLDVHRLGPGNVTVEAVADAHQKDLAVQGKYGVSFVKYWVDEDEGLVYCLAKAPNADAVSRAHAEAHGLVPDAVYPVVQGE